MTIHATSTPPVPAKGQCRFRYQHVAEPDVWLHCDERALPLGALCCTHLLAWAAAQPVAYWSAKDAVDGVKKR